MGNDVGGPIPAAKNVSPTFFHVSPRCIHTGATPVKASTDGTDTTPVVTETYIVEVLLPFSCDVTGFANFNGSVASGNLTAILYRGDGTVIVKSASTAMSGTDAFQRIPFASVQHLLPGRYYVGLQIDNTTARVNTHPIGNFGASKKTGEVYGTATNITPPTTFTASQGPMGGLY